MHIKFDATHVNQQSSVSSRVSALLPILKHVANRDRWSNYFHSHLLELLFQMEKDKGHWLSNILASCYSSHKHHCAYFEALFGPPDVQRRWFRVFIRKWHYPIMIFFSIIMLKLFHSRTKIFIHFSIGLYFLPKFSTDGDSNNGAIYFAHSITVALVNSFWLENRFHYCCSSDLSWTRLFLKTNKINAEIIVSLSGLLMGYLSWCGNCFLLNLEVFMWVCNIKSWPGTKGCDRNEPSLSSPVWICSCVIRFQRFSQVYKWNK